MTTIPARVFVRGDLTMLIVIDGQAVEVELTARQARELAATLLAAAMDEDCYRKEAYEH